MAVTLSDLDAHEQPSDHLRAQWKAYTRQAPEELMSDPRVDDPRVDPDKHGFKKTGEITKDQVQEALAHIGFTKGSIPVEQDVPILHHPLLPGLLIVPNLIPAEAQPRLMDLMAHRDLSNERHTNNMHLHFNVPYLSGATEEERSFFSYAPDSPSGTFTPKDPSVHKPLTPRKVLDKKLHWVTLGGQYDWTNRVYPDERPPEFPSDLAGLLQALFPETLAQAAIVNFYSPGDTMMMHRDVSEKSSQGLVSLSLGCDGLFMASPSKAAVNGENEKAEEIGAGENRSEETDGKGYLLLRLRSGDAIYMTEESRYCWHGVPKVLKGTCPAHLAEWPAGNKDGRFEGWRGWMGNKRINLNVRQMKD